MSAFQSSKIKNIIFDLGGVLLNINPLLSLIELEKISGLSKDELMVRFVNEKIFEKFDSGRLNPIQFRSELCRILNCKVSDSEIDRAWNKLLLDFPQHRVDLLKQLRKNYRVFLLSNTNSIHLDQYSHDFYEKYGFHMTELFEKLFFSHEIGLHKPDTGIYTYLLHHADIEASESVFFDDSSANIEAAGKMGIAGIHINGGKDVTSFYENGILK